MGVSSFVAVVFTKNQLFTQREKIFSSKDNLEALKLYQFSKNACLACFSHGRSKQVITWVLLNV